MRQIFTRECRLSIIQVPHGIVHLAQNMIDGFGLFLTNNALNDLYTVTPIVAKERVSLGDCVDILEQEN